MNLKELAKQIDGDLRGDGQVEVVGLATLKEADSGEVSFLNDNRYKKQLVGTKASAVIVPEGFEGETAADLIFVKDVEQAMGQLLEFFAPAIDKPGIGCHASAIVDASALLGDKVAVGAGVIIGAGVKVGEGTVISPGCVIGRDVGIGDNCFLWPNVVINYNCRLGNNVIIHANSTIGTDGFGYRMVQGRYHKTPHIGTVVIQDDVEIGANSCVDRAKIGQTVVGKGTKIDNLVMVAHNVQIGENCILVAQVGIAGSSELGKYNVFGGQSGLSDHITLGDEISVAAQAGVTSGANVEPGAKLIGTPAREYRQFYRELSFTGKLPELAKEIKQIKKQLDKNATTKDNI